MPSIAIIGAQWGDEGKGKLVDYLTERADLVVRFQGGNNAGHTLVVGGVKHKLSLIPSGILHPQSVCALGAGVVINPLVFAKEVENLGKVCGQITRERLLVDWGANLILDTHIAIDQARESALGSAKIGTTGRGIGPAYESKSARRGIRVVDLQSIESIEERIEKHVAFTNHELAFLGATSTAVSSQQVLEGLLRAREILLPLAADVGELVERKLSSGAKVVFEGAQGTFLDNTFGDVPFVTSSNTIAGSIATGVGIGPARIEAVMLIAKGYATRVGSGPFPTELHDSVGDLLRERGGEFGTVTGRPRRCGWLDCVALKRAVRLNGAGMLALTKLDVLTGFESVKICTGYRLNGQSVSGEPIWSELGNMTPEYVELDGWSEDISSVRRLDALPKAAREFVQFVSDFIGLPVALVSVGAERENTIHANVPAGLAPFVS